MAVIVLVASCSNPPSVKDERGRIAGGTAKTSVAVTTSTVPDLYEVVHPPASGEFVGALTDISDHTCEQEADGWQVTGMATNPTASVVDYRIYISLSDGAMKTRALVESEILAVVPGAKGEFDVLIAMPDDHLRCVLRVERRALGA